MDLKFSSNPRRFMGTTALAETEIKEIRSCKAYEIESIGFRQASRNLGHARKSAAYESPCQKDPQTWDVQETGVGRSGSQPTKQYLKRAARAVIACQGCQVFVQCRALLGTINLEDPEARGVIAGLLVDNTEHGDIARRKLNMPARPSKARRLPLEE